MHPVSQGAFHSDSFLARYRALSSERKAGFFVWPSLAGQDMSPAEQMVFEEFLPSGVILFRRNMSTLLQARGLVDKIRTLVETQWGVLASPLPFVVSIDEEGGRVSRLPAPFQRGAPALDLAESGNLAGLDNQVFLQTVAARALGINCILAPVADILTEPSNPVMGDRCFGREPEIASECALVVKRRLEVEGIFPCVKHFPGHGDTRTDSHKEFAQSFATLDVLRAREWVPFRKLIEDGVSLCMTAHVVVPALDPIMPATLSRRVLQEFLRGELGFEGLIVSDDLRMNAIAAHYGMQDRKADSSATEESLTQGSDEHKDAYLKEAAIDALVAGCDVLLSCQSIVQERKIFEAIAHKLETDTAFSALCEEKAVRIARVLSAGPNKGQR